MRLFCDSLTTAKVVNSYDQPPTLRFRSTLQISQSCVPVNRYLSRFNLQPISSEEFEILHVGVLQSLPRDFQIPREGFLNPKGGTEKSPRGDEIKLRRNEMKLRRNHFSPTWRIFIFHGAIGNFPRGGVGATGGYRSNRRRVVTLPTIHGHESYVTR